MAKGVGKKINQSKIKPVRTKTIHTTSINKYKQAFSPIAVSRQKNQATIAIQKITDRAVAAKKRTSKTVYRKAVAKISGSISERQNKTTVSISASGSVPKNPHKVIRSRSRVKRLK